MTGPSAVMFAAWANPDQSTGFSNREILPQLVPGLTAPVAAMWLLWALLVILLLVLSIYRSRIARDEAGQIFLDDTFSRERDDEALIHARVARIEPLVRITMWLAILATLGIFAYYIHEFIKHLV